MGRRFKLNCVGTCRPVQYKLADASVGREMAARALECFQDVLNQSAAFADRHAHLRRGCRCPKSRDKGCACDDARLVGEREGPRKVRRGGHVTLQASAAPLPERSPLPMQLGDHCGVLTSPPSLGMTIYADVDQPRCRAHESSTSDSRSISAEIDVEPPLVTR